MKIHARLLAVFAALSLAFFGCTSHPSRSSSSLGDRQQTESAALAPQKAPLPLLDEANPEAIGGLPECREQVKLLHNIGYTLAYSEQRRTPLWAAYYCKPSTFPPGKRYSSFKEDDRIDPDARLKDSDFVNKDDYQRGHMAPDGAIGDIYGPAALKETYVTTNITPQKATLNRGPWGGMEAVIRQVCTKETLGLWVIVGPIFKDPTTLLNQKVPIPSGYFFIVMDRSEDGHLHALVAKFDQSDSGGSRILSEFAQNATIREIETLTGINFSPHLEAKAQEALETRRGDLDIGDWRLLNSNRLLAPKTPKQ